MPDDDQPRRDHSSKDIRITAQDLARARKVQRQREDEAKARDRDPRRDLLGY